MLRLPLWTCSFFLLQLLAIAILPLTHGSFWEKNRNKALVTLLLTLPVIAFFAAVGDLRPVLREVEEYASFITLLAALFVVSGGIHLHGDIAATPRNNLLFLAVGALAANFLGTTGASMLLIRPLLRTNRERRFISHIPIFFIFIVGNIGGSLLPLGDPPLFMGFLHNHVPFFWTLRLWPEWLFMTGIVLALFYAVDSYYWRRETPLAQVLDRTMIEPLKLSGSVNFLFIAGILLSVALIPGSPMREAAIILMAVFSLILTPKEVRARNQFHFAPMVEVAVLFAGIFITMVPALILLKTGGGSLGVREPWHFFWATGLLSSFLDNTPTYLAFVSLAEGVARGLHLTGMPFGYPAAFLRAISLGAVFMGANTYIGNAPNFMIKSICEHQKVRMPSFFGYMLWSGCILVPLFLLLTVIFIH